MLHSTSNISASRQTHSPQPTQQSATQQRKPVKSVDTVHFGTESEKPSVKDSSNNILHTTPVVKNLVAGFKNGFKEFKKGSLFNYFGGGVVATILTLPINAWIPGSQIFVIGWYMLMRRAWDGAKGFLSGVKNPEAVFKPQTVAV